MNIQKIATIIAITTGLGIMSLTPAQANDRHSGYRNYDHQRQDIKHNRRANKILRHEIRENRRANKAIRHEIRENRRYNAQRHGSGYYTPHRGYVGFGAAGHQTGLQIQFSTASARHGGRYY